MDGFQIEHARDHVEELLSLGIHLRDVPSELHRWADVDQTILLEGTQGSGLSSVTGPWPYVTSRDTNAGQLCVDAGISPRALTGVVLVARTFPIRVAGNSGPLENERTWDQIGQEPEITTVTKKVRRVGEFNESRFRQAQVLNGPDAKTAIMFLDYIDPEVLGAVEYDHLTTKARNYVRYFETDFATKVIYAGTGPNTGIRLGDPS